MKRQAPVKVRIEGSVWIGRMKESVQLDVSPSTCHVQRQLSLLGWRGRTAGVGSQQEAAHLEMSVGARKVQRELVLVRARQTGRLRIPLKQKPYHAFVAFPGRVHERDLAIAIPYKRGLRVLSNATEDKERRDRRERLRGSRRKATARGKKQPEEGYLANARSPAEVSP
jgi:hypothetical protein